MAAVVDEDYYKQEQRGPVVQKAFGDVRVGDIIWSTEQLTDHEARALGLRKVINRDVQYHPMMVTAKTDDKVTGVLMTSVKPNFQNLNPQRQKCFTSAGPYCTPPKESKIVPRWFELTDKAARFDVVNGGWQAQTQDFPRLRNFINERIKLLEDLKLDERLG